MKLSEKIYTYVRTTNDRFCEMVKDAACKVARIARVDKDLMDQLNKRDDIHIDTLDILKKSNVEYIDYVKNFSGLKALVNGIYNYSALNIRFTPEHETLQLKLPMDFFMDHCYCKKNDITYLFITCFGYFRIGNLPFRHQKGVLVSVVGDVDIEHCYNSVEVINLLKKLYELKEDEIHAMRDENEAA